MEIRKRYAVQEKGKKLVPVCHSMSFISNVYSSVLMFVCSFEHFFSFSHVSVTVQWNKMVYEFYSINKRISEILFYIRAKLNFRSHFRYA